MAGYSLVSPVAPGEEEILPGPLEMPLKFMIFGDSGSGKTMAAARAAADWNRDLNAVWRGEVELEGDERMLCILTEHNAVAAVRGTSRQPGANPKAQIVVCETDAAVKAVLDDVKAGTFSKKNGLDFPIERVMIDGLTELQLLVIDAMYPNGVGKDGINYQQLNDKMRRMLRYIRSLPVDVYVTALQQEKSFGEGRPPKILPAMQGRQTPNEAMQHFEAVARLAKVQVTDRETQESRFVHFAQFSLPSQYQVKPCKALQGDTVPCLAAWADMLRGHMDPSELQVAF